MTLTGSLPPTSPDVSDSRPDPDTETWRSIMPGKYFPSWRTILRGAFVLAVIVMAAQAGRWLHLGIKNRTNVEAARVRKPIPYTTTLRETVHGPDGTATQGPEYTESVRSD